MFLLVYQVQSYPYHKPSRQLGVFLSKGPLAAWLKNVWFAGLWTTGDGEIECPLSEDMFFLPQQPFMPLGTLRQQLLFPSGQPYSAPALHSNQTSTVFMTFEIRYVIQDCNLQLSHCECCHLRLSEYKNHKYNASSAVCMLEGFCSLPKGSNVLAETARTEQ